MSRRQRSSSKAKARVAVEAAAKLQRDLAAKRGCVWRISESKRRVMRASGREQRIPREAKRGVGGIEAVRRLPRGRRWRG